MTGRKYDVLIEDYYAEDSHTGVRLKKDDEFIVWADAGMESVIKEVDGVSTVTASVKGKYYVYIDHRYDIEYIKREVKAVLLCGGGR